MDTEVQDGKLRFWDHGFGKKNYGLLASGCIGVQESSKRFRLHLTRSGKAAQLN